MRFMAIRTERATTRIWTNVIDETNAQGERIVSDSFLILLNANHEGVSFRLSGRSRDQNWELVFDTSSANMTRRILGRLAEYPLQARSVAVLRPEPASLTSL
jgi:isoamylase